MADKSTMTQVLTFKFRLLPTRRQHKALARILESQRQLYNAALQERIEAYQKADISISCSDQFKSLTMCRAELPEMAALPANLQRGTIKRLDEAFRGFFRRVKRGEKPGFPRFRGRGWFNSFEFAEFSGIQFDGKRLRFNGMLGGLRVHLHRALPSDKILTAKFRRDAKGWYVCLAVRCETATPRCGNRHVGIDVGLKHLATTSDGERIPNARPAKRAARKIRNAQRALARCERGSNGRRKARQRVARLHRKVCRARSTHLHQCAAALVGDHTVIAIEDLEIINMTRSARGTAEQPGRNVKLKASLNRSIHDAAWGQFVKFLSYKAERAGSQLIKVDPRGTSQQCSACGETVPKALSERVHKCKCGYVADRDVNAARNILHRAVVGAGVANVAGCSERSRGNLITRQGGENLK